MSVGKGEGEVEGRGVMGDDSGPASSATPDPLSGDGSGSTRPDQKMSEERPPRQFEVFVSHKTEAEPKPKAILEKLTELEEAAASNVKFLSAGVAMLAASSGVAAAIIATGAEAIGLFVGLSGLAAAATPIVESVRERRHRKKVTTVEDIADPVVRDLFGTAATQQELWTKKIETQSIEAVIR